MDTKMMTRWSGAIVIAVLFTLCIILVPARADARQQGDWCCEDYVGDIDMSGAEDITDISFLIDHMFLTLTPLACWGEADFNGDYIIDISDLQMLISAMFFCDKSSLRALCFPDCAPLPPTGSMEPLAECKTQKAVEGQSCIIWEYDGQGRLSIQHVNACLNCCPENSATVTVSGGEITLDETTVNGLCDCICLFDIDFVVENLQPGEYTIAVDEHIGQIWPESFEFTVDLNATPTGMVCLERNLDPYGEI